MDMAAAAGAEGGGRSGKGARGEFKQVWTDLACPHFCAALSRRLIPTLHTGSAAAPPLPSALVNPCGPQEGGKGGSGSTAASLANRFAINARNSTPGQTPFPAPHAPATRRAARAAVAPTWPRCATRCAASSACWCRCAARWTACRQRWVWVRCGGAGRGACCGVCCVGGVQRRCMRVTVRSLDQVPARVG